MLLFMKHPDLHCSTCPAWKECAFQNLNTPRLNALFLGKNCLTIAKHQEVFSVNSKPQGVYCIRRGMIKLVNRGEQAGIEQILNIASPGEIIGLDVVLGEGTFHYSAETLEESEICLIDKDTFVDLMAESADLSREILKRAFSSVKNRDAIISRLTQYNVRERTALTLLSLVAEHGIRTSAGIKLDLHLTRKEIGQYSGTVQESIIRVLSDFKSEGLIDLHKSEITILSTELLAGVFKQAEKPL